MDNYKLFRYVFQEWDIPVDQEEFLKRLYFFYNLGKKHKQEEILKNIKNNLTE